MAGELLMNISKDERERAVYRSRRMYETDYLSNITTAEDRGRREGRREGRLEGRREGRLEGRSEGRREGEHSKSMEIAKKLLQYNRPVEEIMDCTGLERAEIENLRMGNG